MSVELMTEVWKLKLNHAQLIVALALADWGNDDGSSIFPSVARVAWKTGYERRQASRIINDLVKMDLLVLVAKESDHHAREYRMDTAAVEAKTPWVAPGHSVVATAGTSDADRRDIAVSSKPSVEPSIQGVDSAREAGPIQEVWQHYAATHPRSELTPTYRQLIINALKVRTVDECCRAIDRLTDDPFWRPYQSLKYALKGGKRWDDVGSTIDRMSMPYTPSSNGKPRSPGSIARGKALTDALEEALR